MRITLDDTLATLGGSTPPRPDALAPTALLDALPTRRRRTPLVLALLAVVLAGALLLGWSVTRPAPVVQPSPTPTPTAIETTDVTSYTWHPGQGVDPSTITLAPAEVARRCRLKAGEHVYPTGDVTLGSTISVYPKGVKADSSGGTPPKGERECQVGFQEVPVTTAPTELELTQGGAPALATSCRRHTGFPFDDPAWKQLDARVSTSAFGEVLTVAYRSTDGWLGQCLLVRGSSGGAVFASLGQNSDAESQGQDNCPVLQAVPVVSGKGDSARVTALVLVMAAPVWRADGQALDTRASVLRVQPKGSSAHTDFPVTDGVALSLGRVAMSPPARWTDQSPMGAAMTVTLLDAHGTRLRTCTSGS